MQFCLKNNKNKETLFSYQLPKLQNYRFLYIHLEKETCSLITVSPENTKIDSRRIKVYKNRLKWEKLSEKMFLE